MPTRKKGDDETNVVEHPTAAKKAAATKAAPNRAAVDITLPPLSDFDKVEIPPYKESFTKQQGEGKEPRKFSAKGPKAEAVARVLFARKGFTRQQIADIVGCSASRVTEILWALEASVADPEFETNWEVPDVPRRVKSEEPAAEAEEAAAK